MDAWLNTPNARRYAIAIVMAAVFTTIAMLAASTVMFLQGDVLLLEGLARSSELVGVPISALAAVLAVRVRSGGLR